MDYIIIGAGISGLYTAYSLYKKFGTKKIVVLEKNDRTGGRFYSKKVGDTYLEMGAGAVNGTQKDVLKLIDEFGLKDKLNHGGKGRNYADVAITVGKNGFDYRITDIVPLEETDFYVILDELASRLLDKDFYNMALNYSLYRLVEKYYGTDKADQLKYQFGYHADFDDQNAVDGLIMFQTTFANDTYFYKLNGGLSQIISNLVEYLKKNSIEIRLESECIDIVKENDLYSCLLKNGEKISGKNIIFAIPKLDIQKITYLKKVGYKFDSVVYKSLIRIYIYFPVVDGKSWFDFIERVLTTKTFLSQLVPVNKKEGILMVYCDDQNARSWNNLYQKGVLEKEVMYHLRRLFTGINIPKCTKIYVSFREDATHIWVPGVDSVVMYGEIAQPLKNENIYVVGEAFSLTQQWAQGALESVNNLMNKLEKN